MTCEIIVDSCCDMTPQLRKRLDVTSAGEVLIAVNMELLLEGMSKSHIIQTIHLIIENMKSNFVLERYDNLQKNGRLNRITGKLISVLNIKLVMGSEGIGNIALYAKLRGISQVIEKLLSLIESSEKKRKEKIRSFLTAIIRALQNGWRRLLSKDTISKK